MRARTPPRGAALLVVIVAVAVLTALTAQLAYSARVRLQLAGDARDDLRATWLARSGVATSRLILTFQQEIDTATSQTQGALSAATRAVGGGAAGQAAAAAASAFTLPPIRVWSLVPISSGLVTGLFGGAAPAGEREGAAEGAPPAAVFGDFEGAFEASIEDENSKVNVQFDALDQSGRLGPQVLALYQLVCDPRWDPLFDREDSRGQRTTRQDLIVNLRDWVDDDNATAALRATFPGAACLAEVRDPPFESGFGDENAPYDRGTSDERYKAKNFRFDSPEELFLVQGWTDAVAAAFGDRITVYLPRDSRRTIDPRNPGSLIEVAMAVADPPGQAILFDPEFRARLQQAVMEQTLGGLLGVSATSFAQTLAALGVTVSTDVTTAGSQRNPIADRSYVFRIRSVGSAGQVTRTLDVVVTYDPKQNRDAGGAAQPLNGGRVLRWREE